MPGFVNGVEHIVGADTYDLEISTRRMAQSIGARLADYDQGLQDNAPEWSRRTTQLTASDNMDNVTTAGLYSVWSGNGPTNWPAAALGVAEVVAYGSVVTQVVRLSSGATYHRHRFTGGWGPWNRLDGGEVVRLGASSGFDLNTVDRDVTHVFVAAAGVVGLPEEAGSSAGSVQTWVMADTTFQARLQVFHTGGSSPEIWSRFSGSTGWASWVRLDNPSRADRFPSGTDLNSVTTNSIRAVYPTLDNISNAPPSGANGILHTWAHSDTARIQAYYEFGTAQARKVWRRFRGSGSWTDWNRIDAEYAIEELGRGGGGGSASALKTAPVALSAGTASGDQTAQTLALRIPIKLAPTIHRWRLHVRNFNDRSGASFSANVTFSGVWAGVGSNVDGSFDAAPTQVSGGWTLDSDGKVETTSDWSDHPIGDGQEILLSIGFSAASGTWAWNPGVAWRNNGAPGAASNQSGSGFAFTNRTPFTWWLEAEVDADVPVIAMWGDSISFGTGNDMVNYDAPIQQYAREIGGLPYMAAYPGTNMNAWEVGNPNNQAFGRWQDVAKADAVIHFMGQNDLLSAGSLEELQRRFEATVDLVKENISPNLYLATITPSSTKDGPTNTIRKQYNNWLKTLPGGARDCFDFGLAVANPENDALAEWADSGDALHLSTEGSIAVMETIEPPVVTLDDGPTFEDMKAYADAGDAATLSAANEYTDTEVTELAESPGMPQVIDDLDDYAAATVDETGRMSEGTRWDGTKHIPHLEADAATVAGATTEQVAGGTGYVAATVDATGRISEATMPDGTKFIPHLRVDDLEVTGGGGTTTSPIDVVILAGQSNALYRWHNANHPVTHDEDPRLMVWWQGQGQMSPIPVTHGEDVGKGFARAYLHHNPNRSTVIVPCALGSTGFSPSANGTWDRTQPDNLYDDMIDAASACIAAAGQRLGHVMMLWVQGEADRGALSESQYAAYLDDLITTARSDLSAPDMEVIVGSMAPAELLATPPANQGVARAHVDTPRRVLRTAYQFGPEDFQNYQQDIHYSNPGRALKGAQMFHALYRARLNVTGQDPIMPHNLAISRVGDEVRITWDAPPCRFTAFNLEVRVDGGAWTAQTLATPISLDHTMTVAASSTIAARISTTNETGTSYPSLIVTA